MKQVKGTKKTYSEKNIIIDILFFVLSFLLPCAIFGCVLKSIGISYNGDVTLLIYDMQEQYLPLFTSLRYIIEGESSLLYSWGMALGGNNLGTIAYYVASPLSWLTVFFDLKELPNAIYVLTLLKIGLCGLTFSLYVRFGLLKKRCGVVNLVLVCCYALMSYNVIYSASLMWIDGVIFLPLVLLGIEKIIEGKKGFLYFVCILLLFISSYYMSYIVGIFAAFYVLCRIFVDKNELSMRDKVEKCMRFALSTLLAMGIAAPILVSAIKSVAGGKLLLEGEENSVRVLELFNFELIELLNKLLPTQYDGLGNSALPSIYCGSVVLGLAVFYFCRKDSNIRQKFCWLILLLVSLLGFIIPKIDYVWHVFQYPNSFPYRYAFLFSTVLIILANYTWEKISCKTDFAKIITAIGAFYTIVELFFNGAVLVSNLGKDFVFIVRSSYEVFVEQHAPLIEIVKGEKEFYRTEFDNDFIIDNSAYFFGVNGASSFVSTFNGKVNDFLCAIGGEEYSIFTTAKELTPLGDSLLGIKYRIEASDNILGYEVVQENANYVPKVSLYRNDNALHLGYMVEDTVLEGIEITNNPYVNQNNMLKAFGVKNYEVFEEIDCSIRSGNDEIYIEFEVPSKQDVFFYIAGNKEWLQFDEVTGKTIVKERAIEVYSENCKESTFSVYPLTNFYLGNFENGEVVKLVVSNEALEVEDFYLYSMDMEKYEAAITELKKSQLVVEDYKGGNVRGRIKVPKERQILFTTILADGGHAVKIDGKRMESMVVLDTFLAIPLSEGEHYIEISYMPPGVKLGMVLCVFDLIGCVLYFGKFKKC